MTRTGTTENNSLEVLLVTGLDVVSAGRLPSVFHRAGCGVTLISPSGLAVNRSRFVNRHIGVGSTESLVSVLREHLEHGPSYSLVVVIDEPLLKELASQEDDSWLRGWFPVPLGIESLRLITSKVAFTDAAARAGLPVPRSASGRTLKEVREAGNAIGFPLVLKHQAGVNGDSVRVVQSDDLLERCFAELSDGSPLLVQQFVEGEMGLCEVLFDRGRPICWNSSDRVKSWPGELNASCVRRMMVHPDVEPMLVELGKLTKFHGLCGVDCIRDAVTGRLHLIEFNARPTPGYHTSFAAGVDFSVGIRAMLCGQSLVQRPRPTSGRPAIIHLFPQALYLAVDKRSVPTLLRTVPDIPFSDPGLAAAYFRRLLTHFAPKRFRSLARNLARWKHTLDAKKHGTSLDSKGDSPGVTL